MWYLNAKYLDEMCDVQVDWDEEFYICPECGEPVYADDWDEEFKDFLCPVCELTKGDLS